MMRHIIGIDEAGRGPLAGPVAVGAALVPSDFDWAQLPGVTDSKLLSESKRENIYKEAYRLRRAGRINWSVAMVSARVIDQKGIVPAINTALNRSLKTITKQINVPVNRYIHDVCEVRLDGGLKAPAEYIRQETIIKGDQKEQVIGLASIVAKVTRDRYMTRLAKQEHLVVYDLAIHKGYGTKNHREAIKKYGLSTIHRYSFCRNLHN